MSSYTSLRQTQPQARVGMIHLHHFQQRVKCSKGVVSKQLLEAKVVEKDVSAVDPKDTKRTSREGHG